jgi:hypothetical protein
VVILAMLFMPSAMAAMASFDATGSQHLPLPRGTVRGPESVAFDGHGQGPYSSVTDGRVLKWNGDKLGWTTYSRTRPRVPARRRTRPNACPLCSCSP